MKIATYNVNRLDGRLPVPLRWLEESEPDIVCLQELKATQDRFPERAIAEAGSDAIWQGLNSWNGVAILSRADKPIETRRGLAGTPDDDQSRYIDAAVSGILSAGCTSPNGNPRPGLKFDHKLEWFRSLIAHAAELVTIDAQLRACPETAHPLSERYYR